MPAVEIFHMPRKDCRLSPGTPRTIVHLARVPMKGDRVLFQQFQDMPNSAIMLSVWEVTLLETRAGSIEPVAHVWAD